jgi:hypothetical protein
VDLAWQWALIGVVDVIAVLNYFEAIPSLYSVYRVGGFEFVMRCAYSSLIARFERGDRDYPIVWWIVAFLFPPVTLVYLYFFAPCKDTPKHRRRRLDAGFFAACLLYRLIPILRGFLR